MKDLPAISSEGKLRVVFADMSNFAMAGVLDYFQGNSISSIEFLNINYARFLNNVFIAHLNDIYEIYENLDSTGREVYKSYWIGKMSGRMDSYQYTNSPQYFISGFLPQKDDVVIDGGAYDGFTAREFASCGCDVYSFEMNGENFDQCMEVAQKYNFTAENMGLSDKKGFLKYAGGGTSGYLNPNGDKTAQVIDIDSYVVDKNLKKVDFIKMDIEGAELSALRGASNSITKWKPKMAICLYHKPEDLWQIPKYIKSLRDDYEFSMRHHFADLRYYPNLLEKMSNFIDVSPNCKTAWELVLYCR